MAFVIAAILVTVLAGVSAHHLAVRKRRAVKLWVIASVLFILPVFVLLLLPTRDPDDALLNGA